MPRFFVMSKEAAILEKFLEACAKKKLSTAHLEAILQDITRKCAVSVTENIKSSIEMHKKHGFAVVMAYLSFLKTQVNRRRDFYLEQSNCIDHLFGCVFISRELARFVRVDRALDKYMEPSQVWINALLCSQPEYQEFKRAVCAPEFLGGEPEDSLLNNIEKALTDLPASFVSGANNLDLPDLQFEIFSSTSLWEDEKEVLGMLCRFLIDCRAKAREWKSLNGEFISPDKHDDSGFIDSDEQEKQELLAKLNHFLAGDLAEVAMEIQNHVDQELLSTEDKFRTVDAAKFHVRTSIYENYVMSEMELIRYRNAAQKAEQDRNLRRLRLYAGVMLFETEKCLRKMFPECAGFHRHELWKAAINIDTIKDTPFVMRFVLNVKSVLWSDTQRSIDKFLEAVEGCFHRHAIIYGCCKKIDDLRTFLTANEFLPEDTKRIMLAMLILYSELRLRQPIEENYQEYANSNKKLIHGSIDTEKILTPLF